MRRLPRREPQVHTKGQEHRIRTDLPVRLARGAVAHETGVAGADLRQARTRLRALFAALPDAESLLHPGASAGHRRAMVGRTVLDGTTQPLATGCGCRNGYRPVNREEHCAVALLRC